MALTYVEALRAIDAREGRPWQSGLDRMRGFVDAAGLSPTLTGRGYIHIAGTNGKGTTAALVESILRAQGWRTGAFYSPYVVDYRERIQAEGRMIKPGELVRLAERLLAVADAMGSTELGGATKFELETAMGLAYWEQKACEWVALEVGLGGRLDATNVVTPRACAIVSIGLDHTSILGNSVEEIAAEKAGIIKPGIPLVLGKVPPVAESVIVLIAEAQGAPVWRVGREVTYSASSEGLSVEVPGRSFPRLRPTIGGERTPHNVAVALAACVAAGSLRDEVGASEGVRAAWLPGRFDRRVVEGRTVVFDGAHNGDAARALVATLPQGPLVLVTNMVAGHEVEAFYRPFLDRAVRAEAAPIDSPRALSVQEATARLERLGIPSREHGSVQAALRAALASDPDKTIVVTGSNYLVGEALRSLDKAQRLSAR